MSVNSAVHDLLNVLLNVYKFMSHACLALLILIDCILLRVNELKLNILSANATILIYKL
jgi:hypothetical protein